MPLDAPGGNGGDATVRRPGDFKRKGVDGPPYVASLTKTRQPTGKKDELIAQAVAKGIDVPGKVTIPQLKELIGLEPAWDLYGRPSGYGDLIDNPFNLIKWKERQLVLGIAIDPSLLRELDGCDESSERAALDKIAARAHAAADSDLAAERGTFVHLLTEWAEDPTGPRPIPEPRFNLTDAHVDAIADGWLQLLADNELEVIDAEAHIVNDASRLAGNYDRLVRLGRGLWFDDIVIQAGEHVIVDIKTSKLRLARDGTPDYWDKFPIQVVVYRDGQPYDATTDTRGEWVQSPNADWGLIAHLDIDRLIDDGEAVWQLIAVNLDAGRQGVAAVEAAQAYHARPDKFAMPAGPPTVTQVATSVTRDDVVVAPSDFSPEVEQQSAGSVAADPALELANDIGEWGGQLKTLLVAEWPSGVPTPKKVRAGEATWDAEQLERVRAAVNEIVGPFDDPPVPPETSRFAATATPRLEPVDGGPAHHDDITALVEAIKASPVRDIVNAWLAESADAGCSWSVRRTPRMRHYEVTAAAFRLAEIHDDGFIGDPDPVRTILVCALGTEKAEHPTNTIGVLLAQLTINEARAASGMALALAGADTNETSVA